MPLTRQIVHDMLIRQKELALMACADREEDLVAHYIATRQMSPDPFFTATSTNESFVRSCLNNNGFSDVPCGTVTNETCKQLVRRLGIVTSGGGLYAGDSSGGVTGTDGVTRAGG